MSGDSRVTAGHSVSPAEVFLANVPWHPHHLGIARLVTRHDERRDVAALRRDEGKVAEAKKAVALGSGVDVTSRCS